MVKDSNGETTELINEKKSSSSKQIKFQGEPKKPMSLIFQVVAKLFCAITSIALICQYVSKFLETLHLSKQNSPKKLEWKELKTYFISVVNVVFGVVEVFVVCCPQLSSIKKKLLRTMQFACSPLKTGIFLVYMSLCLAPDQMF